jgi:uncharacterized protein YcaQ
MIEKQGIGRQPPRAEKADIFRTVDRLGCVQIDSINVVERAHYLTLWSRLGQYEKTALHDLLYRDRQLFEHWAHAASIIPLQDYRFFLASMQARRMEMRARFTRRARGDPALLDTVLARIRREGPLAAKDFASERATRSRGWWDWKPAKVALEVLFGAGILLIAHRENFQRFYDLAERVLPDWVDRSPPTVDERIQFFITHTMHSLGLVTPADLRDYYRLRGTRFGFTARQLKARLETDVHAGTVVRYDVAREAAPSYALVGDAPRIDALQTGAFDFTAVRFFTNFDNLLWNRKRVKRLFNFDVKLETYLPREQRKYGYYNLPILYGDRLVGRIVPKMDRQQRVLRVHSIWYEPVFTPDERFKAAFAETLESFARFHGADAIAMPDDAPRTSVHSTRVL